MRDPKSLADHYFALQCERLGPIEGVPAPRAAAKPMKIDPEWDDRTSPPLVVDVAADEYWKNFHDRLDMFKN